MEFVQVPLNIAIKASRVYRQLLPFVRKHISNKNPKITDKSAGEITSVEALQVEDLSDFVAKSYQEAKDQLMNLDKSELVKMAKEAGIFNPHRLSKEALVKQLTTEEETLI